MQTHDNWQLDTADVSHDDTETSLSGSLNALLLAFLTARYFRLPHRDGAVLAVGWLTYPITRFVIEYLRGDELGKFNTSLTISQWVSIGMLLSGIVYTTWLTRQNSGKENPKNVVFRIFHSRGA